MTERGFVWLTHSDARPHFTVQSARQNWLVTRPCKLQSCYFLLWIALSVFTEIRCREIFQSPFPIFIIEKLNVQNRWMIKKKTIFYVKFFSCVLCFCPNFCHFVCFLCFLRIIHLSKARDDTTVWLDFCLVKQGAISPHEVYQQGNFYKKFRLCLVGCPSESGKS